MSRVNEPSPETTSIPAWKRPRTATHEADAAERACDFRPVDMGYTAEDAHAEAERCMRCTKPRCVEACPVSVNIPAFITEILEGDDEQGLHIIRERNLLPSICGRVCPQERQCEGSCILGRNSEPIAIGRLERYLGDRSEDFEWTPEVAPSTGKRCAVVGSGPAGLSCAGELARLGHDVTIFESFHVAGGVLSYGIPEFRLPKSVVRREIDALMKMGVRIEVNSVIGHLATVEELLDEHGFDAVFMGIGAGLPVFLDIPGEHLNGVFAANEFLTRVNLMRAYEFPKVDTPVHRGKHVAVVGGGNVAMDAARTALRLGAEDVTLVYRRTEAEMPARAEEVHHARQEGVQFCTLTSPLEITGEDGFVSGLRCQSMVLGEPDAGGRRRPVPVEGGERVVPCDTVIIAVGTRTNPLVNYALPEAQKSERGYLVVDESGATTVPGVWAGGDIVTGAATVILAMGAGKTAATSMDEWLRSK